MRFLLITLATTAVLVALLVRGVADRHEGVITGYTLDPLRQEQQALREELSRLQIDRAALVEPAQLARKARAQGLIVPPPDGVVVVPIARTRQTEAGQRRAP